MPRRGEYAPGTSAWARRQAERFESSGGIEAATLGSRPIVVLTSVGARTGKLHKTALMRVEREGEYAVVASNGGSRRDPAWVANICMEPHVELQDGGVRLDYLARELDGDERRLWWERAVEAFPQYERYEARTTRRIPVFLLTRRD